MTRRANGRQRDQGEQLRQRMTAVIIRNHRILLIKRAIYGVRAEIAQSQDFFWTVPGGGQKPDETPIMTLYREVRDELNIDILQAVLLFTMKGEPMPPGVPERVNPPCQDEHFFLIDRWQGEPQLGEELLRKMKFNPQHRYLLDWAPLEEFMRRPYLRKRKGVCRLAEEFLKVPIPPLPPPRTSLSLSL